MVDKLGKRKPRCRWILIEVRCDNHDNWLVNGRLRVIQRMQDVLTGKKVQKSLDLDANRECARRVLVQVEG